MALKTQLKYVLCQLPVCDIFLIEWPVVQSVMVLNVLIQYHYLKLYVNDVIVKVMADNIQQQWGGCLTVGSGISW